MKNYKQNMKKDKIYKFCTKLLCLFIPNKKLIKGTKNHKTISINELKEKYPDSIFLMLLNAGLGEFSNVVCLLKPLKEKINKNIVLIVNRDIETKLCSLFDSFQYFYKNNLIIKEEDIDYNKNHLPEVLDTTKIYPAYKYFHTGDIVRKEKLWILYYKNYFNLDKNTKLDRIKPSRPENNNQDFLDIEKIFKNEKVIFIFPEANTFDCSIINKNTWLDIANKLKNQGYTCIFNSKDKYDNFINIFFDIKETIYLANLANSIISFRAGMSELLAISTTCNMIVVYPNAKTHLFSKSLCYFDINEYSNKLRNNEIPILFDYNKEDDNTTIIQKAFQLYSIPDNFDRENCVEYIYDFNDNDFYNFILTNI